MSSIVEALQTANYYAELSGLTQLDVERQYYKWLNRPNLTLTASELIAYVNEYFYVKYEELMWSSTQAYMFVLLSVFGFFGYLIQAAIQRDPEFKPLTFWYQKAEVLLELVHMLFLICFGLNTLTPNDQFWWTYFSGNLSNVINKMLILTTDILTFFVCLERSVAIVFPSVFVYINNRPFAIGAIGFSVLCGGLFGVDFVKNTIEVTATGVKSVPNPNFSQFSDFVKFRDAFLLAKGYAIAFLSAILLAGLIKISRRRQIGDDTAMDKPRRKTNIQTCIFSICYGIPVTINSIIFVIYNENYSSYTVADTALVTLSYSDCFVQLRKQTTKAWLLLLVNFSMCLAHCIHFYINLSLSPMFRRIFLGVVRKFMLRIWFGQNIKLQPRAPIGGETLMRL